MDAAIFSLPTTPKPVDRLLIGRLSRFTDRLADHVRAHCTLVALSSSMWRSLWACGYSEGASSAR
jgi:hypothetical protein